MISLKGQPAKINGSTEGDKQARRKQRGSSSEINSALTCGRRGGTRGRSDPSPPSVIGRTRAQLAPSRSRFAHACIVVVATPGASPPPSPAKPGCDVFADQEEAPASSPPWISRSRLRAGTNRFPARVHSAASGPRIAACWRARRCSLSKRL